jgi:hypothetical protein
MGQMSSQDADCTGDSPLEACRERLAAAEKRYRQAVQAVIEAEAGKDEAAIAAATEQKNSARVEYHRLLRVFSDLVVRGKTPKGE